MNYHLEHHLFPLVPYHALPSLHHLIKDELPALYNGLIEAYREMIPTVLRQMKDSSYHVNRTTPTLARRRTLVRHAEVISGGGRVVVDGWIDVYRSSHMSVEDVVRFDYERKTYAIFCDADGSFYATDGICTHGKTHLAEGMVNGNLVECAKHNGRFDITDGTPKRKPVCIALKTQPVCTSGGNIFLKVFAAAGEIHTRECAAKTVETH